MTNTDAFYIQQALVELEFPFMFEKALQFALFRTYGIPSISKLLVQTSQFSEPATATKRYADTGVLITELAVFPPESERVHEAIARINYIHSWYQKAGKILDDDTHFPCSRASPTSGWHDTNGGSWRRLRSVLWALFGRVLGTPWGFGTRS